MAKKNLCLSEIVDNVVDQLKSQNYMDSTIESYQRIYRRIERFMQEKGACEYSEKLGEDFLNESVSASTMNSCKCAVRRLNDLINGLPYRCHHDGPSAMICDDYKDLLEKYLDSCVQKGNKPATIYFKRDTVTLFLNYVRQSGCENISNLTADLAARALLIFDNKDRYAIIRMFLRYLVETGYTAYDFSGIVPHYKRKTPLPTVYSPEEIQKIESAIDTATKSGARDLAMIRLATRMGLRAGDIAKLRWDEIDLQTGSLSIVQGKTGQPLELQMPDEVAEALKAYREDNKSIASAYDFVFHEASAPYGPITTSVIRNAFNKYMNQAGINISGRRHGPHAFRSSLATSMVNDDVPYETVRRILGHTDPNVVKHYAKTDIEHLRLCSLDPPEPSGIFADYLSGREVISRV